MVTQSKDGPCQRRKGAGVLAVAVLLGAAVVLLLASSRVTGSAGTGFASPPQPSPRGGALRGGARVTGASEGAADAVAGVVGGISSAVLIVGAAAVVGLGISRPSSAGRSTTTRVMRCAKGTPLEELSVGDTFDGKVTRVAQIGIWLDIGAEKEALWPKMQLPKGAATKYKPGDTVEGLKVFELQTGSTPSERKIRVKLEDAGGSSFEVGTILDGTVKNVSKFGIFLDVDASSDVLCPNREVSEEPSAYEVGQKVKVKVIKVDGDRVTVSMNLEASASGASGSKSDGKPLKSFSEGDEVVGTVVSVNASLGLFLDIGAQKNALCRPNQLAKALSEYNQGDKVTGLKISSLNIAKEQVEVSSRPLASESKQGDKLEGTVLTVSKFGVFFDAGLATDVLVPNNLLAKPAEEYKPGEVADLVITQVQGNRITATSKAGDEMISASQLVRGSIVSGKIKQINNNNVIVDVGALRDAVWRVKDASSYNVGDEVQGLIVIQSDPTSLEVSTAEAMSEAAKSASSAKSLDELAVGSVVDGTITRIMPFGIFVDIGAERDALWATNQLEKPASEYKEGETVTGLRITQSDPAQSRLSVSFKKSAADYSLNDAVSGKVTKVMAFGVFVDIGASVDALAFDDKLAKDPSEYSVGDELTDISISQLDVQNNKISVTQAGATGGGSGKLSMDDLKVGQKIEGIVKMSKDYGVFMDIGLNRKDALLPASLFGEAKLEDFKEGSKVEVFIAAVDTKQDRVTLSVEEPTQAASAMSNISTGGDGMPIGFMVPDPKIWKASNMQWGSKDRFMEEEPMDWHELAKRHPDLIHISKQASEPYFSADNWGLGFKGASEFTVSEVNWIPVPVHLRKPDAGPAEIPAFDYDDHIAGYDYGIKPEIHVKYRQPPFNDPNWTYREPTAEDFARAERAKLQRAKSEVAQAVKDE
mmetsp:Transcript_124414/g.311082  ORF Transcript_124414/g.311082 Transcript_124414/m.311082 type:complete len:930 (+) Transcript_124414:61-2850(+)